MGKKVTEIIICDRCGYEEDFEKTDMRVLSIPIGREADAAGSMNQVWAQAEVCPGCIARMFIDLLHMAIPNDVKKLEYLKIIFGDKLRMI